MRISLVPITMLANTEECLMPNAEWIVITPLRLSSLIT